MKSKDQIIATLKKIKAMADKGCNEQEVEIAARMLQSQMEKYGITLDELRDEKKAGAECEQTGFKTRVKTGGDMGLALGYIGRLFDCKVWYTSKQDWTFFGLPGDTQAACALAFLIEASVKSETRNYGKSLEGSMHWNPPKFIHDAKRDFRRGFLVRISVRLREMKQEQAQVETKNALVVLKKEIVQTAFESTGISVGKARPNNIGIKDRTHFAQGQVRGGSANLNVGGQVTQQ